jgi:hypothetical protein
MEKPEVLKTFRSRIEAEVAKSYLESMGIESSIKSDDADQLYPSLGVVKGIKLLVKDVDLKRALDLLEEKEEDS